MDQLPTEITSIYLPAIEAELEQAIEPAREMGSDHLYHMLAYHMGWKGSSKNSELHGKRFRPMLVLLTCSAVGGDWHHALPVAAAVELVHNFSLIHDDIEDHSPLRRGRTTVWKKWGISQAINTGDAMFTLAHLQTIKMANRINAKDALIAVEILHQACLHLTQGQYLDLAYEKKKEVSMQDYWLMVEGKTAALIASSTTLGALAASCSETMRNAYTKFGKILGLAFQVHDDYLGIWGKANETGKSTSSDIVTRKKTLPILFGLSKNGRFASRWKLGPIHDDEVKAAVNLLEAEGGKDFTRSQVSDLVSQALGALDEAHPSGEAGEQLIHLAQSLLIPTE